jgi:diguanylate cyclase (GGDEF)-like protein
VVRSAGAAPAGTWRWRAFAVAGLVAALLYLLDVAPIVSTVAFAVIGIGVVWACFTGPRRLGAEPRAAWLLMGVAALCFLIGVVVRPWASAQPFPTVMLADTVAVPGYVLTAAFLVMLLRARRSLDWLAVLDGLIVCLAGGLVCALLLAAPAVGIDDRPALVSVLAGMFPLLDMVLVLLVVNLTFTTAVWPFSLLTFLGSMTLLFAGDLAYAIIGTSGQLYASPLLDLPFLVAYTFFGITALHPSVVELSRAGRPRVQAWSGRRMALLAPALAAPFVLLVTVGGHSPGYRLTIAVTGGVMTLLLLARAVSAVRAQAAAQLRSEHQARHDPLTGLPNRGMISAEIERLLRGLPPSSPQRVWVYLLDLDGFKWVNESWGHDTGDQLVIEAAARLRAAVPAQHMVARVGGDEFLIAYVGAKAGALRLVDEVRCCFARPLEVRGTDVVISASVGLAHAAGDGDPSVTAEALMRDADTAMYRSKADGPGRSTIFDTSMHDRVRERIELETALRTALADGQLRVAYQPIVQLDTGRPVGAEALARWHHPERGEIPPMAFIPIAEDTGMIGQIGAWVRREALRQLGEWRANGTVADDFYLSVNISPRQLNDPELPLIVAAELLEHHVPARAVALEMTESVMVDGSSVTSRVLFELRELGVRLLVDDFGTGFSALGYLRRFPVTGVKIDRSFVAGLGQSPQDEEIVRAVVAMSAALGLSIVAEGVENRRQRDALAAVGVTQGQGWLWGPAVDPVDFAALWHAGGPAARAAAAAVSGLGKNQRATPPRAKGRNQLPAGNA